MTSTCEASEPPSPDGAPCQFEPTSVTVRVPAKLNLHLGIHPGRDERGYHRADSLMVAIDLFDEVSVSQGQGLSVRFEPPVTVPMERTTAWRAVTALALSCGREPHLHVRITRDIPSRGGMGSASADAAAALVACCALWGVDRHDHRIHEIAHTIGADTAFFLDPNPSLLSGIGDRLVETYPPLHAPVALIMPAGDGVSTKATYDEFDRSPSSPSAPLAIRMALAAGNVRGIAASLHNNLADAAARLDPKIGSTLAWLREQNGVLGAQVTGSGSCAFAICDGEAASQAIVRAALACGWWARAAHTIDSNALELFVVK